MAKLPFLPSKTTSKSSGGAGKAFRIQGTEGWARSLWLLAPLLGTLCGLAVVTSSKSRTVGAALHVQERDDGRCMSGADRALVVVLAQTRGYRLTWDGFQKNLLHNLTPNDTTCTDLALAVGQENNTDVNPFYQHARYVWVYPEVEDWGEAYDDAARAMNCTADWRSVLKLGEQWLGGIKSPGRCCEQPGSAGILIFFRWFLLQKLKEGGLLEKYSQIMVTRPDYVYQVPHPPLSVLKKDYIWLPEGEQYFGVTDRHIIAPSKWLAGAIDMLSIMMVDPQGLIQHMQHIPNWNLERVIQFTIQRKNLWQQRRFFPYIMFTVRDERESSRWSWGEFSEEAGFILKYGGEWHSARHWNQTIKSNADWERHFGGFNYSAVPPFNWQDYLNPNLTLAYPMDFV